jgi:quinol monooxygenase YgiN
MSVLITVKVPGDTELFVKSVAERGDEFLAFVEKSQKAGAIHHRFGVGDGFVLVVDEWETVEGFQAFFGRPEIQAFIPTVGGDTSVPPEVTVTEAISSADEY